MICHLHCNASSFVRARRSWLAIKRWKKLGKQDVSLTSTNRKYSLLFSSPGSQGYTERAIPNFLDFVNNSYRHALQFIKLIKMCPVFYSFNKQIFHIHLNFNFYLLSVLESYIFSFYLHWFGFPKFKKNPKQIRIKA